VLEWCNSVARAVADAWCPSLSPSTSPRGFCACLSTCCARAFLSFFHLLGYKVVKQLTAVKEEKLDSPHLLSCLSRCFSCKQLTSGTAGIAVNRTGTGAGTDCEQGQAVAEHRSVAPARRRAWGRCDGSCCRPTRHAGTTWTARFLSTGKYTFTDNNSPFCFLILNTQCGKSYYREGFLPLNLRGLLFRLHCPSFSNPFSFPFPLPLTFTLPLSGPLPSPSCPTQGVRPWAGR